MTGSPSAPDCIFAGAVLCKILTTFLPFWAENDPSMVFPLGARLIPTRQGIPNTTNMKNWNPHHLTLPKIYLKRISAPSIFFPSERKSCHMGLSEKHLCIFYPLVTINGDIKGYDFPLLTIY